MIINNEIRTKHQTRKENKLYSILDDLRRNLKDYNEKENNKRKQRKN